MKFEAYTVAMFVIFLIVDLTIPFRQKSQPLQSRWLTNYGLYLINWFIERGLIILVVIIFAQLAHRQFGLFSYFESHPAMVTIASFLALDIVSYVLHRLKHSWNWLWRIHRVHHSDRDLDFTTGLRFHPVEKIIDSGIVLLTVFLLGVPVEVYVAHIYIVVAHNYLVHSNIAFPVIANRWISNLFITPNLHRVHHAEPRELCDSNYGIMFSVWDHYFRTLRQIDDQKSIQTGISAFTQPDELSLFPVIKMPFR